MEITNEFLDSLELFHFDAKFPKGSGSVVIECFSFQKFDKYVEKSAKGGLKFAFKKPVYIAADRFNTFELCKVIDTYIMVFTKDFNADIETCKMKFAEACQQSMVNSIVGMEQGIIRRREWINYLRDVTKKDFEPVVDGPFRGNETIIYTL